MTVIYIHAIGLDRHLWHGVMGNDSVAIDLPGHGSAPAPSKPVTFSSLVDYLAALVKEPADIVGISLGSMLAQHFAIARPDLVRSLVLACAGSVVPAEIMRQRAADTRDRGMEATLASTLERWFTAEALRDPEHQGVRYARQRLLQDDPTVVGSYWDAISEHDVQDSLARIRVPTTVIGATADLSFPLARARDVADRISNSRFREIEGPHMVPLEDPEGFAKLVSEHLDWTRQ